MIGDFFSMLFTKLTAIVAWFGSLFVAVFTAGWDFVRDAFAWLFDQLLGVAVTALGALNLTGITNNVSSYGSIPANVMAVMSAIGLGVALGLIASALVIRFTLQLIPFVRLGS